MTQPPTPLFRFDSKVAKVHHRWRRGRRWRRHRHGWGAAAGFIGFAAGAALAAQAARDCGYVTVKKRRWNRWGERVIIKKRVLPQLEDIADLKIPFVKAPEAPKRVTRATIESLLPKLQPGDVFITMSSGSFEGLPHRLLSALE